MDMHGPVDDRLNPREFELETNKHKRLRRLLETVAPKWS